MRLKKAWNVLLTKSKKTSKCSNTCPTKSSIRSICTRKNLQKSSPASQNFTRKIWQPSASHKLWALRSENSKNYLSKKFKLGLKLWIKSFRNSITNLKLGSHGLNFFRSCKMKDFGEK
jgi:hypothetical protein